MASQKKSLKRKRGNKGSSGRRKARKPGIWAGLSEDVRLEVEAMVLFVFTALTLFSMWGWLGSLGNVLARLLNTAFGSAAWLLPMVALYLGFVLLTEENKVRLRSRGVTAALLFIVLSALFHTGTSVKEAYSVASLGQGGGYAGYGLTFPLFLLIGRAGTAIVYTALMAILLLLTLDVSLRRIFLNKNDGDVEIKVGQKKENIVRHDFVSRNIAKLRNGGVLAAPEKPAQQVKTSLKQDRLIPDKMITKKTLAERADSNDSREIKLIKKSMWHFPSIELLNDTSFVIEADEKLIKKQATIIGQTLFDFGIDVEMNSVNIGPTVVQYTLKPATGIKLSKIVALQNDLALALAAESIRIEAPIPGQALVGIEIPNKKRAEVALRGVLESQEFKAYKSPLAVAIGRDVSGKPVIESLAQMPHLLIAGATGSGKSVCINTILLSLLYNYSPKDLRLIVIDPKRVELNIYANIPHLLTPVIVNVKRTISALRWVVAEMNRRYRTLASVKCKNIAEYNKTNKDDKLPYIVIVIDELADLMMLASKEVEALVCRLAQMARAVGIHMVLATQRPSVDVITGLIKANMPVRFAFTVVSATDSRTIIDQGGAEKLLGKGDMLYISAELPKPKRVQGAFVDTDELKRVINDLKLTARPEYNEEIVNKVQPVPEGIPANKVVLKEGQGDDTLEKEAMEVIMQTKKASASLLQRYLKVGYARAARILDELEQKGVVGPAQGSKPRRILIDLGIHERGTGVVAHDGDESNEDDNVNEKWARKANYLKDIDDGDDIDADPDKEDGMERKEGVFTGVAAAEDDSIE